MSDRHDRLVFSQAPARHGKTSPRASRIMRCTRTPKRRNRGTRRAAGFTYLGLLFLVVLMGLGLSAVAVVWHTVAKRSKEAELVFIGEQFKRGLKLYQQRSPDGNQLPKALGDLVLDPRFPNVQRHLRRIYRDPMTGRAEWGLIKRPDEGIFGVYSLSEDKPLRVFGGAGDAAAATYAEWKFAIDPAPTVQAQTPGPAATTGAPQGFPLPPAAPLPGEPLQVTPAAIAGGAEQSRLACFEQRQAKARECQSSNQYRTPAERSACAQAVSAEFAACTAAIGR